MDSEFLGLRFAPVALEHRASVGGLLSRHALPLSDYNFASLVVWEPVYHYRYAVVEPDTLLLSSSAAPGPPASLLQPVGSFPEALQETILDRSRALPEPLRIESVSEEFLARHPAFASRFEVVASRDTANYVYGAEDLAELRGRNYAKKRNLIAQAARLYSWTVERLGPEHVQECLEVGDDIAKKRTTEAAVTLAQETEALGRALSLFVPLGLSGLLVRVEGSPAAFSIFDRLSEKTAVVLFERALRSRKGLYQVINQETARVLAGEGYELINREEDLGDPGLRQGKLSYLPRRLEMKHTLVLRR